MSDDLNEEAKFVGDLVGAVIVYDDSLHKYRKGRSNKKMNKSLEEEERKSRKSEEVIEEEGDLLEEYEEVRPIKSARIPTSADEQITNLADIITKSDDDNVNTRKKLSSILKSGDPLLESRTVMIVLARKEMGKVLTTMDAIDRLEQTLLDRITRGEYDQSQPFDVAAILQRLEVSMGRSLTIISKVLDNPAYEEFMLAYRDMGEEVEGTNISKVANDKGSRQKVRNFLAELTSTLGASPKKEEKS